MTESTLPKLTPMMPYLVRSIYEWMIDNGQDPMIIIDPEYPGAEEMAEYAGEEGLTVLNISPDAVRELMMLDDVISFNARFGGVATDVVIPIGAVRRLFIKDYPIMGMSFPHAPPEAFAPTNPPVPEEPKKEEKKKVPHLRIVK